MNSASPLPTPAKPASSRPAPLVAAPISSVDIEAIAAGRHHDPFAILGPHETGKGLWDIRAMLPESIGANIVLADGSIVAMEKRHDAGIYAVRVASHERPYYHFLLETSGGDFVKPDAYRFGPVLSSERIARLSQPGSPEIYESLGAHVIEHDGARGTVFAVWAPNARRVSVVGDFNLWDGRRHPMRARHEGGVWEIFMPGVEAGARYKYEIVSPDDVVLPQKADPCAFQAEVPSRTASVVHGPFNFQWSDADWMAGRGARHERHAPISIYECHLGSWQRVPEEGNRYLTYRELAERLVPYVRGLGFTHIELMPMAEYPFDGSWGYQPVSLFAPTSRFGSPEDFAFFVDTAHRANIGIIVDWVPGHFPNDPHGIAKFDGTHLYEHADPRQGFHPDWNTHIYNLGRAEVSAFLIANARFWVETYHIDGLRVDAVASMLYLDYSRKAGEWIANRNGGRENLEAIEFLKRFNETIYGLNSGAMTIAEESTSWPGVSRPVYAGGLGFGYKWNMGWMHDTLDYIGEDPVYRQWQHNNMTFGIVYAYSENFVLPLSHDEVVHGKGSLISRIPGDDWQKFATLRAYYAFMWTHPGKKLLFMGCEFAQLEQWNHDHSLDWHLMQNGPHAAVRALIGDLNALYQASPALHRLDCEASGFTWLIGDDRSNSVFSYARFSGDGDVVVCVANFTPVPRFGYRVPVPDAGTWDEVLNTDAARFGGGNIGNNGAVSTQATDGGSVIDIVAPPLATVVFRLRR